MNEKEQTVTVSVDLLARISLMLSDYADEACLDNADCAKVADIKDEIAAIVEQINKDRADIMRAGAEHIRGYSFWDEQTQE